MKDGFGGGSADGKGTFFDDVLVELTADERAFLRAVLADEPAQVGRLAARGVSPDVCDAEGRPALLLAAQHASAAMVTKLLELGADPNATSCEDGFEGSTALMGVVCGFAPRQPDLAVLDALLAAPGLDLDARDDEGWTALMHAVSARGARTAAIRRLVAAGADPDALNFDGESVREMAEERGVSLEA